MTGWDTVRGLCRDAGRQLCSSLYVASTDWMQDCGIRHKGASPTGSQHTFQSKSYGQTCLRSRGTFDKLTILHPMHFCVSLGSNTYQSDLGSRGRTTVHWSTRARRLRRRSKPRWLWQRRLRRPRRWSRPSIRWWTSDLCQ